MKITRVEAVLINIKLPRDFGGSIFRHLQSRSRPGRLADGPAACGEDGPSFRDRNGASQGLDAGLATDRRLNSGSNIQMHHPAREEEFIKLAIKIYGRAKGCRRLPPVQPSGLYGSI